MRRLWGWDFLAVAALLSAVYWILATDLAWPVWALVLLNLALLIFAALPLTFKVQDRLVGYYLKKRRPEAAIRLSRRIEKGSRRIRRANAARIDLSFAYILKEAYELALKALERVNKAHLPPKTRAVYHNNLAYCLARLGKDGRRAQSAIEEALRLLDHGIFHFTRGLLALNREDFQKAARSMKTSFDMEPADRGDPHFTAERAYEYGRALEGCNREDEARAQFELAEVCGKELTSKYADLAREKLLSLGRLSNTNSVEGTLAIKTAPDTANHEPAGDIR